MLLSYAIQSCTAIVAFISLLFWQARTPLRSRSTASDNKRQRHIHALVTALVEFQKAQCYFACAIQIAGLIYINQVENLNTQSQQDIVMIGIACTIGFVPVVFVLTCINHYGRESWYLTAITFCSCALSTITLGWVERWWNVEASFYLSDPDAYYIYRMGQSSFPACGFSQGFTSESYSMWCPSQQTISPVDPVEYLRLIWTSWIISTIWLFISLERKARSFRWWPKWTERRSNAARLRWRTIFGNIVYYSSWPVAFGIQFYLVSQYLSRSGFITPNWAFGQIVAVTAWVPCLVEYLYLEIRKHALPKVYRFC